MVADDPLLARVAAVLDPQLSSPGLAAQLTARIRALDATAPIGWEQQVLTGAPGTAEAIVTDALYEHGLQHGRVGPDLAPHVGVWSPPPAEQRLPTLLGPDSFLDPSALRERYDAVVIGSGAGGGMAAQVLAEAGWSVLVLERGSWPERDRLLEDHLTTPRATLGLPPSSGPAADAEPRLTAAGEVPPSSPAWCNNAMTVGGGTRMYGAQAWRFVAEDFTMASTYGVPDGSSLADWPLTAAELAPFYARVEDMLGVSGGGDLPMPPLDPSPLGGRLAAAGKRLGLATRPVPLLINTVARRGRAACVRCSQCVGFDCPVGARAGSHTTTLPAALATGRAHLLPGAVATRILTDAGGRATGVEIVLTGPGGAQDRRTVLTEQVVLSAGAIESARLVLDSGLGGDEVGRHLQGHAYGGATALFEDPVVDLCGPGPDVSTERFRHGNDGIIGGGILADEFVPTPAATQRYLREAGLVPAGARAGSPELERAMLRLGRVVGPVQEVTTSSARVRLDRRRDRLGRSLVRLEGHLHPEDLRGRDLLSARAAEWLAEAGARRVVPAAPLTGTVAVSNGQHQAGTLRMGTDPSASATDPHGRLWGHPNVLVADASVHVTNGGANPVLTVLALALRHTEQLVASA